MAPREQVFDMEKRIEWDEEFLAIMIRDRGSFKSTEDEVISVSDHRCNGILTDLVLGVDEGELFVYKLVEAVTIDKKQRFAGHKSRAKHGSWNT